VITLAYKLESSRQKLKRRNWLREVRRNLQASDAEVNEPLLIF